MLPGNSATHLAPASKPVPPEPIAIVGMACRFPGAPGPDEFWQLLLDGRSGSTPANPPVVARHRRQRSNWLLAARARPVPPGARPTTAKGKSSGGPRSAGLHSIAAHRRRPSRDLYQSGERVEVQP